MTADERAGDLYKAIDAAARGYKGDDQYGLPWDDEFAGATVARIAAAIRQAVLEERSRCAEVVRGFATGSPPGTVTYYGEGLASAIMDGPTP